MELKDSFKNIFSNRDPKNNIKKIENLARVMYQETNSNINLLDMIFSSIETSDNLFTHTSNVALISVRLGQWLGFNEKELSLLMKCAIFHDIGMTLIPSELIEKKEHLTSDEIKTVRKHTTIGYEVLNKFDFIDDSVKRAALLHHERYDGSGYPLGLKGDEIDDFSKIIAIADVYCAMTSPRPYREAFCPFQVIEYFETDGLHLFDPEFLLVFLTKALDSYLFSKVLLNDGRRATVIKFHNDIKSKPLVQLEDGTSLDLHNSPSLRIVKILI